MTAHPLDRVIWEALTTRQVDLAEGNARARRYVAAVAPFAATADDSVSCLLALQDLVAPGDRIALTTSAPIEAPPELVVTVRDTIDQMVLDGPSSGRPDQEFEQLGVGDVPAMLALVASTRPGPFASRTIEMGRYLGLKVDGNLVAMTGERMRMEGFTEVSAVCVAPAHRGQGLAAELVKAVASGIIARGEVPFLNVFASNTPAIALYRKLGFNRRRQFHLTILTRPVEAV